jgi:hypothetical protein
LKSPVILFLRANPVECAQASLYDVEGLLVPKWVTAPGWYRQCSACGSKDLATWFHINNHLDEPMFESYTKVELPELSVEGSRKCDTEFAHCSIYTTGDVVEDGEWGLEDAGITSLPRHTPGYVFQLVRSGIEGTAQGEESKKVLIHYLDQPEILEGYRMKKETGMRKLRRKT